MAYDVSVKKELANNGVTSDRVNTDSRGNVTVDNQPFMKPQINFNGTTYTDQSSFNNALNSFKKSNPTFFPATQAQPRDYTSQYNQLIGQLMGQVNAPQTFDPYSSPQYSAAQAEQQRLGQQATRQAQEAFGQSGFGRSTNLSDRIQRNQTDSNNYLMSQVVPSIIAQHNNEQQQKYQQIQNLIGTLMSADQNQFNQNMTQQQFEYQKARDAIADEHYKQQFDENVRQFGLQNAIQQAQLTGQFNGAPTMAAQNQQFNQGITQAQLTGEYLDPQKVALKQEMDANSAAWFNASPADKERLHNENVAIAQQLGIQYDPATGTYSEPDLTIPTLAAKEAEYRRLRDQIQDTQYKQTFDENVRQFGLQFAADEAQRRGQLAISQQNANTSARNAETSASNAQIGQLLDIWKATGKAPAGLESLGVQPGQEFPADTEKAAQQMDEEKRGLVDGLRSGQITPATAYQQIDEDVQLGFYTPAQAEELKAIVAQLTPTIEPAPLTQQQQDSLPSDKQLDDLYKQLGHGKPRIDWKDWYVSPQGRLAGVDFDTWHKLYGPKLTAGK